MSYKPTPGPWKIHANYTGRTGLDEADQYEIAIYAEPEQIKIAVVESWLGDIRTESDANARLIAAAPTLAQAAKEAAAVLAEHVQYDDPAEPSREAQALKALTAALEAAGIES
jgi:hypothetical protein